MSTWSNSPPLSLSALRGMVVLVDFWTYSCITAMSQSETEQALDKCARRARAC